MRLLAFLLIWISLGVGAVAATTAYTWKVPEQGDEVFQIGASPDGTKIYAVLAAPAGKAGEAEAEGESADTTAAAEDDEEAGALVRSDTALTPDVVATLREAGVTRVRVKTFKLSRWTHLPHFGAACIGLLAGAILTRLSAAREAKLADADGKVDEATSPERALAELRAVVQQLLEEVPGIGEEHTACHEITGRLGEAIRDLVPVVTEQRDRLVGRMGLGGYATLMDTFAAAERSLNRAWSAAADYALEESLEAMELAGDRLIVAEDKLTGRTPSLLPAL